MDYRKYLRKLRQLKMSQHKGIVIGIGIAAGVVVLAAAVCLIIKCLKKSCGCMDYDYNDFDDDDDFDDDECVNRCDDECGDDGCGYASDKDFIK